MRPAASAAALLFASAAALPAQTSAPRDTAGRDVVRRDTVVREYTIRRFGPDDDDAFARGFGDARVFLDGPGRVDVFRTRAEAPRSALGLYLGRADADGLRVDRVAPDGPAARAGIAAGDRLVAVNGRSLRVDQAEADDPLLAAVPARRLERAVGRLAPGSEVELRVHRDGRERVVRARTVAPSAVAERGGPALREYAPRAYGPLVERARARADSAFARAESARDRADSARARAAARPVLGLTIESSRGGRDTLGVFVAAVAPGGPAERAGVVEGDRVATINNVDLRVPREEGDDPRAAEARRARFTRELERLRPGDRAVLRVYGDGRWRTVTATVGRAGDVYPRSGFTYGFGTAGGPEGVMRSLRMVPMPNAILPRLRLLEPGVVPPVPPRAPLPPLTPHRRTVAI